jgi:hypothetical protein
VRAQLRGVYSPDIPDLEAYRPDDGECFQLAVTAFFGPANGQGEEMFDFIVCTATWLHDKPPPKGFQFMRSTILLSRWDYAILNRALADLCTHTEADDWPGVALRLSRYRQWEYEDYTPPAPQGRRRRAWWSRGR